MSRACFSKSRSQKRAWLSHYDADGISVRFMNSNLAGNNLRLPQEIKDFVAQVNSSYSLVLDIRCYLRSWSWSRRLGGMLVHMWEVVARDSSVLIYWLDHLGTADYSQVLWMKLSLYLWSSKKTCFSPGYVQGLDTYGHHVGQEVDPTLCDWPCEAECTAQARACHHHHRWWTCR